MLQLCLPLDRVYFTKRQGPTSTAFSRGWNCCSLYTRPDVAQLACFTSPVPCAARRLRRRFGWWRGPGICAASQGTVAPSKQPGSRWANRQVSGLLMKRRFSVLGGVRTSPLVSNMARRRMGQPTVWTVAAALRTTAMPRAAPNTSSAAAGAPWSMAPTGVAMNDNGRAKQMDTLCSKACSSDWRGSVSLMKHLPAWSRLPSCQALLMMLDGQVASSYHITTYIHPIETNSLWALVKNSKAWGPGPLIFLFLNAGKFTSQQAEGPSNS